MTIPGSAPSTPASHDPAREVTLPWSYSAVSSPRYQTFPSGSSPYQSRVSSITTQSSKTLSRTTVARIPRMSFVRSSTSTSTCSSPSKTNEAPTSIGKKGFVTPSTNVAGSNAGVYGTPSSYAAGSRGGPLARAVGAAAVVAGSEGPVELVAVPADATVSGTALGCEVPHAATSIAKSAMWR